MTDPYAFLFIYMKVGAGTVNPVQTSSHAFPPSTLSPSFSAAQITLLPTYTATGKIKSLFAPTFTAAPSAVVGTGWTNKDDKALAFVYVSHDSVLAA